MRKLLLLPLFFGMVSPAIAHNQFNGGCAGFDSVGNHCVKELGWNSTPRVNSNLTNKPKEIIIEDNSQSSLTDNQVDDSNLNEKKTSETKNPMAIYIVIGILVIIIPLVIWSYFIK